MFIITFTFDTTVPPTNRSVTEADPHVNSGHKNKPGAYTHPSETFMPSVCNGEIK
jgi:hypothetical protein